MWKLRFNKSAQRISSILDAKHIAWIATGDKTPDNTAATHGIELVLNFDLIILETKETATAAQRETVFIFITITQT